MGERGRLGNLVGSWIDIFTGASNHQHTQITCVGLIILAGCFTMMIVPDAPPEQERPISALRPRPTIIVDPGHGGKDEGARYRGVQEKTLTLRAASQLALILHDRGYPVLMTRTEDVYVSLAARAALANSQSDPALFVSIHFNQGGGNGIETFYAPFKSPPPQDWTWVGFFNPPDQLDSGRSLAMEVQAAVLTATGARDRGIRARSLYVVRNTRIPAVLVEGGFLSNRAESRLLKDDDYMDSIATGIADGIEEWWKNHRQTPPAEFALRK